MKFTLDTDKKTITFMSNFTMKDLMKLSKYVPDIENWSIEPYITYTYYPYNDWRRPYYSTGVQLTSGLDGSISTTNLTTSNVGDDVSSSFTIKRDEDLKKEAVSTSLLKEFEKLKDTFRRKDNKYDTMYNQPQEM